MRKLITGILLLASLFWAASLMAADPPAGDESSEFYFNRGLQQLGEKQQEQAISDFTRAIEKDPQSFSA